MLRAGIDESYRDFVTKVAEARHRKFEQIEPLSQGRVWMGDQAKANGLVDEVGGLDTALNIFPQDPPATLLRAEAVKAKGTPMVVQPMQPAPTQDQLKKYNKAMKDGKNGYAPSQGIKEALEAIRAEAARKGITSVQDAFVTTGVSETVDICLAALLNPGEDILTPSPDYPLYSAVLAKLGIGLNTYWLNEDDGWQPDLMDIHQKITPRTRGIVLINPNNPTGSVCSRPMLEQIAELARRHNLVIFADEIYDKLILEDDKHISMAAVAPDVPVVTFGGLSKNYLAPGWRVGWGIVSGDAAVHFLLEIGAEEVRFLFVEFQNRQAGTGGHELVVRVHQVQRVLGRAVLNSVLERDLQLLPSLVILAQAH